MMENHVFNLFGAIDLISQSIWIKVDHIYLVANSIQRPPVCTYIQNVTCIKRPHVFKDSLSSKTNCT